MVQGNPCSYLGEIWRLWVSLQRDFLPLTSLPCLIRCATNGALNNRFIVSHMVSQLLTIINLTCPYTCTLYARKYYLWTGSGFRELSIFSVIVAVGVVGGNTEQVPEQVPCHGAEVLDPHSRSGCLIRVSQQRWVSGLEATLCYTCQQLDI